MMEPIQVAWSIPLAVDAWVSTRAGGVSTGAYQSLNLATHVGDDDAAVQENRRRLQAHLGIDVPITWMSQVHGTQVATPDQGPICADAVYSNQPGQVCAVLTADCLPILLCNHQGTEVAAVHAGWRGLAAGVLEAALVKFHTPAQHLYAWLGPAIGPESFEVGSDVRDAFIRGDEQSVAAFVPGGGAGRYYADLYALARIRLRRAGVLEVSGGGWCTVRETERFFSYRRDGVTGRMASLIRVRSKA